jgi:hypothetical protein
MFARKKNELNKDESQLLQVERRAAIRYASEEDASCALGHQAPRAWGRVRDISALGIGLLVDREIIAGTRLMVEIAQKKPSIALRALGRVVHCRQQSETTWAIGCQFDNPLRDEDVQSVTAKMSES